MSGPPQYPGPDPAGSDDPFDRPPDESGERRAAAAGGWTGGASGASTGDGTEPTAPIAPDQAGYWERKAAEEQAARDAGRTDPPPASTSTGGWATPEQPVPYGESSYSPYGSYPPPPPAYPQPAGAGAYSGGYYATQQAHPQSTTALVLGLVGLVGGLVCCLPLVVAPFAWVVGGRAKREIDASNGQLGGRSNAQAGYVMGIIGTVLAVLVVIGIVVLVIGLVALDDSSYNNF